MSAIDAAVRAMLPLAGRHGWNWRTLRAGLAAAGEDPALVESYFPAGPVGAIAAWADLADRDMVAAASAEGVSALRVPARIRRLAELRLQQMAPHKPAVRAALAHLALPWNLGHAACIGAWTTDAMWRAAGDRSADFSWYTRRLSLGAINAATLAYWVRDDDPEIGSAMAFLDRRLAELARLQRRTRR
jgi:ubiquinone biosynthesis protein COQ9